MDRISEIAPELAPMIDQCDFLDVVDSEGDISLREFIAGMGAWLPWWLKFLYLLRSRIAPLFSIRKIGTPLGTVVSPDQVPFEKGAKFMFGKVLLGVEERLWAIAAEDNHLKSVLAVAREPLDSGRARFSIITIVKFVGFSGRAYIFLIKPLHALLVRKLIKTALTGIPSQKRSAEADG